MLSVDEIVKKSEARGDEPPQQAVGFSRKG